MEEIGILCVGLLGEVATSDSERWFEIGRCNYRERLT